MWRDILLVVCLILGVLTYFRLTPQRISRHFRSVSKNRRYQIISLLMVILMGIGTAHLWAYRYDEWQAQAWSNILLLISLNVIFWHVTLRTFWGLSGRAEKIVSRVLYSLFLTSFIASVVMADMPIWKKICFPTIGFGVGYGLAVLESYVTKRIKARNALKS